MPQTTKEAEARETYEGRVACEEVGILVPESSQPLNLTEVECRCSRGYDHHNEEETQKFIIEMKKLQLQNRSLDVEFRKEKETLVKDIDESITKMRENVGEDLDMIFNAFKNESLDRVHKRPREDEDDGYDDNDVYEVISIASPAERVTQSCENSKISVDDEALATLLERISPAQFESSHPNINVQTIEEAKMVLLAVRTKLDAESEEEAIGNHNASDDGKMVSGHGGTLGESTWLDELAKTVLLLVNLRDQFEKGSLEILLELQKKGGLSDKSGNQDVLY